MGNVSVCASKEGRMVCQGAKWAMLSSTRARASGRSDGADDGTDRLAYPIRSAYIPLAKKRSRVTTATGRSERWR